MCHHYWWGQNLGQKILSDGWMLITHIPRQHKIRYVLDPSPLCQLKSFNHCEKNLSCWQQTAPVIAKQNLSDLGQLELRAFEAEQVDSKSSITQFHKALLTLLVLWCHRVQRLSHSSEPRNPWYHFLGLWWIIDRAGRIWQTRKVVKMKTSLSFHFSSLPSPSDEERKRVSVAHVTLKESSVL